MKRARYYSAVIVLILIVGGLFIVRNERRKPDFVIQSTMKSSFDNYETVDLSVIVFDHDYKTDELFEKIREYYANLNKMPDELSIRLYDSKREYTSGTAFSKKLFLKEEIE